MNKTFAKIMVAGTLAAMLTIAMPMTSIAAQAASVSTTAKQSQSKTMYVIKTCYSYKSNSTKSAKVKKLSKGAAISVVSEKKTFYKLADGSYVLKSRVGEKRINWTVTKYKTPLTRYVLKDNTKVRSSALSSGKVASTVAKDTKLTITGKTNSGFYQLDDGNFIKTSSVTKTKPASDTSTQTKVTADGFEYFIKNGEVTVTQYKGKDPKKVVFPSEIEGCPVTKLDGGSMFFDLHQENNFGLFFPLVEEIVIPGSVKVIGGNIFSHCSNLSKVTISEGVRSIQEGAFFYCPNLNSISLPDSIVEIGDMAFDERDMSSVSYKGKTYTDLNELYKAING